MVTVDVFYEVLIQSLILPNNLFPKKSLKSVFHFILFSKILFQKSFRNRKERDQLNK